MENLHSESSESFSEREFKEFMQRGDDFFKIELLRPAKNWYIKALDMNIETETVKTRLAECDKMLAFENKVISILGILAAVLLFGLIML